MSSQLKIVVLEILKNKGSNEYLAVEDIVERVKKNRNFARVNEKALKANISNIINEIKKNAKAEELEKEKESENIEKENKMLGKKRLTFNATEGKIIFNILYLILLR
jgi:hypothetical protein